MALKICMHLIAALVLSYCFLRFSGVSAQVIRRGSCPNIPPVRNFNVDKMTGVWYLQYLYFACAQVGIKCSVFNMTVIDYEGKKALFFQDRSFDDNTGQLRTRNSTKILDPKNPAVSVNKISSACHNDTLTCAYVSTGFDYEYFINYCCKPFKTNFKYESLGVRTRDKNPSTLLRSRINVDLLSKGINVDFMYPIDQDCVDSPLI